MVGWWYIAFAMGRHVKMLWTLLQTCSFTYSVVCLFLEVHPLPAPTVASSVLDLCDYLGGRDIITSSGWVAGTSRRTQGSYTSLTFILWCCVISWNIYLLDILLDFPESGSSNRWSYWPIFVKAESMRNRRFIFHFRFGWSFWKQLYWEPVRFFNFKGKFLSVISFSDF